jgi:hypothetical protein
MQRARSQSVRSSFHTLLKASGTVVAAALLLGFAQGTRAQALGAKVGTSGLGAEFSYGITSMFGVRANLNGGSYSRDVTRGGIKYDAKAKFSSAMLIGDFHPFSGGFRLSGGAMVNNNKGEFTGIGESGTFTINGVTYPVASVGSVNGTVEFDKLSPYVGLGWGAAPKGNAGLFASVDVGAVFQQAKTTLVGNCAPSLPANVCAQLQSDLDAEALRFADDVKSALRVYPVLTIGIGYRF